MKKVLKRTVICLVLSAVVVSIIWFLQGFDWDFYNDFKAKKYEKRIVKALEKADEIELQEVFTFSFDRAYVVYEPYFDGERLSKQANIHVTNDQMTALGNELIRRVIFVDEDGYFLYEFRYNTLEFDIKDKGIIVYPESKMTAWSRREGVSGIEFLGVREEDCFDEKGLYGWRPEKAPEASAIK